MDDFIWAASVRVKQLSAEHSSSGKELRSSSEARLDLRCTHRQRQRFEWALTLKVSLVSLSILPRDSNVQTLGSLMSTLHSMGSSKHVRCCNSSGGGRPAEVDILH